MSAPENDDSTAPTVQEEEGKFDYISSPREREKREMYKDEQSSSKKTKRSSRTRQIPLEVQSTTTSGQNRTQTSSNSNDTFGSKLGIFVVFVILIFIISIVVYINTREESFSNLFSDMYCLRSPKCQYNSAFYDRARVQ